MTKKVCRSDILTKEFLEECFVADFETGTLTWKFRPLKHFLTERGWKITNTQRAGKVANLVWKKSDDYVCERVTTGGKHFPVQHVIWTMFYGEMIDTNVWEIDHIDRNPRNNSIHNLRKVTRSQNTWNTAKRKSGASSEFKGVCFDNARNKWLVQFLSDSVRVTGRFERECDASFVYRVLCENTHGDYLVDEVSFYEFTEGFVWNNITPSLRKYLFSVSKPVKEKFREFFEGLSGNIYIAEERETNTGISKVTLVTPTQKSARDMRKFVAKFDNITKSFSVSKYGYDKALDLACQWAKFGELESF